MATKKNGAKKASKKNVQGPAVAATHGNLVKPSKRKADGKKGIMVLMRVPDRDYLKRFDALVLASGAGSRTEWLRQQIDGVSE